MYSHVPPDYACIFCQIVSEARMPHSVLRKEVIFQNNSVTAFLGIWHRPGIPVDVIVIPNEHFENIYEFPPKLAGKIQRVVRAMSLALKEYYHCDGITIRQNNEPAGGQDVWHYHVHVTPRSQGDQYSRNEPIRLADQERFEQAARMRNYIKTNKKNLFESKNRPESQWRK